MAVTDITPNHGDHWTDKISLYGFAGDVTIYATSEDFKMNADQARLFALAIIKAADYSEVEG